MYHNDRRNRSYAAPGGGALEGTSQLQGQEWGPAKPRCRSERREHTVATGGECGSCRIRRRGRQPRECMWRRRRSRWWACVGIASTWKIPLKSDVQRVQSKACFPAMLIGNLSCTCRTSDVCSTCNKCLPTWICGSMFSWDGRWVCPWPNWCSYGWTSESHWNETLQVR